ncbi:MAG: N-acetyl-1-D-myo-inositol-2-amino-2-deoxy-alpha-D-glucopyranoside deacetylase [Actinomycetes bacterium]
MKAAQRLLLVHAHPDDETINTGALMAMYAAKGAAITLVTCTLGDEGEILVPQVAHLASDRDGGLGAYRLGELRQAMTAVGVQDVRILGGAGRWRDSGMAGTAPNDHPSAFMHAPLDATAGELARIICEVQPQVVITYDSFGGYGHPDHIKAHDITHAAVAAAAQAGWTVSKVYACARRRRVEEADRAALVELAELAETHSSAVPFKAASANMDWATDDASITTAVDASTYIDAKREAMLAHATQISVSADGCWYALSDGVGAALRGVEYLTCVHGETAGERDADGFEVDVFAGVQ